MKINVPLSVRLSNHSIRIMCDILDEVGIDWLPLAARAGIDPMIVEDPQGQITRQNEFDFQHSFAHATRNIPDIGFRTGLGYHIMSYGPFGIMALVSDTVETALRRIVGSSRHHTYSQIDYGLLYEGDELRGIVGDASVLSDEFREFCQQRDMAIAVTLLRELLGRPFPLECVCTPMRRPSNWADWESQLGTRLIFGADTTRIIFQSGAGAERLPMANEMMEAAYSRRCAQIVEYTRTADDFVQKVSDLLLHPQLGIQSATEVASRLAISERTLQRKLAQRNRTFVGLLNHVREKRARELLNTSSLRINQIAEALGFAETASFSRAFKIWTGLSPIQYRKRKES